MLHNNIRGFSPALITSPPQSYGILDKLYYLHPGQVSRYIGSSRNGDKVKLWNLWVVQDR